MESEWSGMVVCVWNEFRAGQKCGKFAVTAREFWGKVEFLCALLMKYLEG
jgi:hypothetical protein